MCECGCSSNYDRFTLSGPDGLTYLIEFGSGCQECETPAGVVIGEYKTDRLEQLLGEIPPMLPLLNIRSYRELAVGIAEPHALAHLCISSISRGFNVKDELQWPEEFEFDPDEFKSEVYSRVERTLSDSVRSFPKDDEPLCDCNPEEQTGGGHHRTCPAYENECTCLEAGSHAGHEPGCAFYRRTER